MNNQVLAVDINMPGIEVAIVDNDANTVLPGTAQFESVDCNETVENFIDSWAETITRVHALRETPISNIGIAIPGPFDYENGISLMTNQNKFESLYQVNVKKLLADKLGISPENIRMSNNGPCFLMGEVAKGSGRSYHNVLGFTLNQGLGSARYYDGKVHDAELWNKPFKDGIAEDYLGITWLTKRYKEFTGINVPDIKELTNLAQTDDGIGQLVFNEYGENFVKFLLQYISAYDPELILIGGHNDAWDLFIDHVRDRLGDKNIKTPIKSAELGPQATLIGAAHLWS